MSFDTPGLAMQEATKWKTGNRLPSMTRDDTVASSDPRYALPRRRRSVQRGREPALVDTVGELLQTGRMPIGEWVAEISSLRTR